MSLNDLGFYKILESLADFPKEMEQFNNLLT